MGRKGHNEIRNKDVRSLMYLKLKKEKEKVFIFITNIFRFKITFIQN